MRRNIVSVIGAMGIALCAGSTSASAAELSEITVAQQYGIAYLQLIVMQKDKLLEKQLKAQGLKHVKITWNKFSSSAAMVDAVLSGHLQFATGGLTPLITVWDKTRGSYDVKGICAMNAMPLYLNTRNPDVKTIRDFTDKDKIALPAVKLSQQALTLEMAAAQVFGDAGYAKLDPLTVSMSHPDGMQALLSGRGEIDSHLTSPPYSYQELDDSHVHKVFSSYDVTGGPTTFTVLWTTGKFRKENPKEYKAFFSAFKEATDIVNKNKRAAAQLWVKYTHSKLSTDEIYKMVSAPDVEYTLAPKGVMQYATFMHKHGLIKEVPKSWKDVFFENVHGLSGS